jgi:APA family basic amino acid/polyamine antiporter
MARKLAGLERVFDLSTLAAVAYGEIGSSLYFALGIIALYALGVTPWVLLAVGLLFLVIALSYAEGTAAFPETGGAATFVRRAFNDPLGFLTGWMLFLDYLIVIALAALFVPHYLGTALGWDALTDEPWDVVAGVGVIGAIAGVRLVHRPHLYRLAIAIAVVAFTTHVLLVALGFALLVSTHGLSSGVDLGTAPTWRDLAFAIPLAMLAFTGLETVANLASETRDPSRTVPRSLFVGIGAVVGVSVLVAIIGLSAYPAQPTPGGPGGWATQLGVEWVRAPLVGIAAAFDGHLPDTFVDVLKVAVGVTGAVVLAAAVSTSISGVGRLAYSLARHEMLPHAFARLSRRTLIPPVSIVAAAAISALALFVAETLGKPLTYLASLYSFGILLAFVAAQSAVLRLRFTQPHLQRPFRAGDVRIRGVALPLAALVGLPLTLAVWGAMLATHQRSLMGGVIWLGLGVVVYVTVRVRHREHLFDTVVPAEAEIAPEPEGLYQRILVPLKAGPLGEDVLGTAIKLAEELGGQVTVLHVVRVPLDLAPDTALPAEEERATATLADARRLAAEHGVEIEEKVVRHQDLGTAIVDEAVAGGAELIVMGSSPRWRRWSQFVSPTVDKVMRRAPSEVMVVAYPDGYFDEDGAPQEEEPS